jgi:hypothetical protein
MSRQPERLPTEHTEYTEAEFSSVYSVCSVGQPVDAFGIHWPSDSSLRRARQSIKGTL